MERSKCTPRYVRATLKSLYFSNGIRAMREGVEIGKVYVVDSNDRYDGSVYNEDAGTLFPAEMIREANGKLIYTEVLEIGTEPINFRALISNPYDESGDEPVVLESAGRIASIEDMREWVEATLSTGVPVWDAMVELGLANNSRPKDSEILSIEEVINVPGSNGADTDPTAEKSDAQSEAKA